MPLKFIYYVMLAPLSALLLTPLGWDKFLLVSGKYVPEVFLVSYVLFINLFLPKSFLKKVFKSFIGYRSFFVIVVIFLLYFIGFYRSGDVFDPYSDFRSIVLMYLTYRIVRYVNISDEEVFNFVIAVVTLALFFYLIDYFVFGKQGHSKYGISIPMFMALIYISGKNYLTKDMKGIFFFWSISLCVVFLAVISAFRSNLLISVLMVSCFAIYGLIYSSKSLRITNILTLFGLVLFLSYQGVQFWYYVQDDPALYHQLIYKTEQALNGEGAVDELRAAYIPFILSNFIYFILPSGLGYESLTWNWKSLWLPNDVFLYGSSIDSGIGYLSLHFGLLLTFIFLAVLVKEFIVVLFKSDFRFKVGFLIVIMSFLIYFFYFGGHMFSQVGNSIGVGLLFGVLLRRI